MGGIFAMETIWQDLTRGMSGSDELTRVIFRLLAATVAGALVGFERERERKAAGLRTHTLVAVGSCLLILAGTGFGMSPEGMSRVVQGIVTGIGFLGVGNILKLSQEHSVKGLTTAAGIWATAAIGVACGLGMVGLALIGTIVVLIVLALIKYVEHKISRSSAPEDSIGSQDQ